MTASAASSKSVVGYVYALIAVMVAMSVAAVGTIVAQHRKLEQTEAQVDDYHVSSIRHAAALGNEVLQIKALTMEQGDRGPPEAGDPDLTVSRQLLKAVSEITNHLEELRSLLRRYPDEDAGLEESRFLLFAQDVVALRPGLARGRRVELLLRLRDEDGSIVAPFAFLRAAERYNLMPAIDRWVVRTALTKLAGDGEQEVESCSINLSGLNLTDDGFLDFVLEQLGRTGVAPSKLCFEITETAAITHLERARELMIAQYPLINALRWSDPSTLAFVDHGSVVGSV